MNTTTTATGPTGPRRVARIATVATTLAVVLLGFAVPAQAWVYSDTQSRPGHMYVPQVNVGDLSQGYDPQLTFYASSRMSVGRSPATSRAQDVSVAYLLERWNGSAWRIVSNQWFRARIAAGQSSASFAPLRMQPSPGTNGYYRVRWFAQWNVAGTSTVLGAAIVAPSSTTDHRCATPHRACRSSSSNVRVGKMYVYGGGW